MSTSFSKLADYLSEIYSNKCRDKNFKSECEFKGPKNIKVSYNCNGCGKKQLKLINRLIKKFPNTQRFCSNDINKFILVLRKGFYSYEYMDSKEGFNETTLPNKNAFYSKLYKEDITDEDYIHAQNIYLKSLN